MSHHRLTRRVALLAVPVGVTLWLVLWSAGFVASIVGFVVAIGTAWLYQKGAPGPVERRGVTAIIAIIVGTMALSIVAGLVFDTLQGTPAGEIVGVLSRPDYWSWFFESVLADPYFFSDYGLSLLLAVLFTALGTARTIARLVRSAR